MNNHDSGVTDTENRRITAGKALAERREKLGLTIEECAETLKLSVNKIKALEADNDLPFTSEIFLRGYLKNYAKLVDLPESEVIYYYESQRQPINLQEEISQKEDLKKSTKKWWLPYFITVLVIVAWFVVSNYVQVGEYWQSTFNEVEEQGVNSSLSEPLNASSSSIAFPAIQLGGDDDLATPENNDFVAPLSHSEAETVSPDSSEDSTDSSEAPISPPAVEENLDVSIPLARNQSSISTSTSTETPSVNSALDNAVVISGENPSISTVNTLKEDLLYFTFIEPCWVQVIDAKDRTIVSSLRKANSDLLVKGQAPFSIVLGNVNGATLRFNDEPIALANSLDGRTLRLTVGS